MASSATPSTSSPDPVLRQLATRAKTDPEFNVIMRAVAAGKASKEQLESIFQTHCGELKAAFDSHENGVDDADLQPDEDEDDYMGDNIGDKEAFNEDFKETKAEAEEVKARKITESLRKKKKTLRLGNLRGKWTLYSSAYLDCIKQEIWDDSPYSMSEFEIGTMEIDEDKIEGLIMADADLGAEFMLGYCDEEGFQFEFKTPKHASTTPSSTMCCFLGGGRYIPIEVSFLGSRVCKMTVDGFELGKLFQGEDKINLWRYTLRLGNSWKTKDWRRMKSGGTASTRGICILVDGGYNCSMINVSRIRHFYREGSLDRRSISSEIVSNSLSFCN
jgi:hypothetical protein